MSEMVERVAMRMAQMSKARVAGMHTVNALPMDGEENFLDLARAAIEAMREPTVAMIDRGCADWANLYPGFEGEKPQPTAGDVASAIYAAMISAALKD
jgi:hypothetical protein